jgi:hypothetical protein
VVSDIVPAEDIERIVGVERHPTEHWGRAVSAEQRVYILHSQECLDSGRDLRECPYSLALDNGIDPFDWTEDVPVSLWLDEQDDKTWLVPEAGLYNLGPISDASQDESTSASIAGTDGNAESEQSDA